MKRKVLAVNNNVMSASVSQADARSSHCSQARRPDVGQLSPDVRVSPKEPQTLDSWIVGPSIGVNETAWRAICDRTCERTHVVQLEKR